MIRLIEGASGSGKSHLVYEELIQASMAAPGRQFFFIVPEQFTMQAQRDIVTLHPRHGSMNIDIVSFNRLAYRIFEELNIRCDYVLEDFGKSMLLQRILMKHRRELPVFGASCSRAGFLDELKSLLTELFQYRIGREDIQSAYDGMEGHPMLREKLHDLLFVYDAFQEEVQGHYIIAEHILEMLARHISESCLLQGSILYLDGFTGFTPIQYEVLEELAQVSESMNVTVTIDRDSAERKTCEEHDLFYISKDTILRIRRMADRLGIYVEEEILEGRKGRFDQAAELRHLEQNLFRYPYRAWEQEPKEIRIQVMEHPRAELHQVARQIRTMVRQGQCRYQDIAVIHGNLEELEPLAEEIFSRLDIPYFIDTNRSIYMNPCLEAIRAVLEIAEQDYSYESVFRLLKTGVTGLDTGELEMLENYVLHKGIRGFGWWNRVFAAEAEAEYPAGSEQKRIFSCGRAVLELLTPVTLALKQAGQVNEYVEALRGFLGRLQMKEQLEALANRFEEQGNLVQARFFRQVDGRLTDIWEKMTAILGTEEIRLEEFRKLLEAGLDEISLGMIPPSLDQVTVGDIERTRLNHVKVLFVIGVNDGIIPRLTRGGGILSEGDRGLLSKTLELAPDSRSRVFTEQFYLYQNVTKPSRYLFLTYHAQDGDGNETLPAYLINRICRLFPKLVIEELTEGKIGLERTETAEDSMEELLAGLQDADDLTEGQGDVWRSLYEYYSHWAPAALENLHRGLLYHNLEHKITREAAAGLYGEILNASVSRLETYSRCPYQFFLEYGIKLKKRETHTVTLSDMGNLLHHVVEQVFRQVENRQAEKTLVTDEVENVWDSVTDETLEQMVEEEIRRSLEEEEDSIYLHSHANRQLLRRIQKTAAYAVVDLKRQLLQGRMIPYRFEMAFNRQDADPDCRELEAAELPLEGGRKMRINGLIDRLDICQDEECVYVRVLDYKSSGREIDVNQVDAGLQLQLLLYTNVVLEVLQRQFPDKQIVPAGSLYYGFRLPMVEKTGPGVTDALNRKISRETALTGIVNREEPCVSYLGGREILPIRVKETEEGPVIQDSDTALTGEQYQELLKAASETAAAIGTDMLDGRIPIQPVRTGRSLPCDYCDYRDVCKLDCEDGGNRIYTIRRLQADRKGGRSHGMDGRTESGN